MAGNREETKGGQSTAGRRRELTGQFANASAGVSETVLAGGRKVAQETQFAERVGLTGRHRCGRDFAEALAEEAQQAFHEGRIGVATKPALPVTQFAHDPSLRNAPAYAVRLDALGVV